MFFCKLKLLLNKGIRSIPVSHSKELYKYYYHGSQFWSLNHNAVDYILQEFYSNFASYRCRFGLMFAPDEVLIQTIIMHSNFSSQVLGPHPYPCGKDALVYNDQFRLRDRHSSYITAGDVEQLANSRACFARKVDMKVNPEIIDVFLP